MSALGKLTVTEAKLFLRDPGAVFTVIAIPLGLIVVFGLMPSMREPSENFGGDSALSTFIAPMAVALLIAMLALNVLPTYLATYREKGILRRLSASPVHPGNMLASQLLVQLVAALVMVGLLLAVGSTAMGLSTPRNPALWALVLVLGIVAMFSLGLFVASIAPSGKVANGIGLAFLFPMMALGGVWVPKEQLPGFLQHVADLIPFGAMLNGLRETWAGNAPNAMQLIALAAVALVTSVAAAKLFRWE